jgi:hypothetical protein
MNNLYFQSAFVNSARNILYHSLPSSLGFFCHHGIGLRSVRTLEARIPAHGLSAESRPLGRGVSDVFLTDRLPKLIYISVECGSELHAEVQFLPFRNFLPYTVPCAGLASRR